MAASGSVGCSRAIMGTRLQWLNLDGGYKTYYFSYDVYSRHMASGIGIEYVKNDEGNGMITNDHFQFTISPAFSFGKRDSVTSVRKVVVKPALAFGVVQYQFDWNKYTWGDQIDPLYGFIYHGDQVRNIETVLAPDFGAGLFSYGNSFFAGLYFHHITEPSIGILYSNSPLWARMVIHAGYLLKEYNWLGKVELVPSFIYDVQNLYDGGGRKRTELTLIAKYSKFMMGISGRFQSAFVFIVGFQHKFLKLNYAYDINLSHVRKTVGSTHEIMFGFNFACRKDIKQIRTLDF